MYSFVFIFYVNSLINIPNNKVLEINCLMPPEIFIDQLVALIGSNLLLDFPFVYIL